MFQNNYSNWNYHKTSIFYFPGLHSTLFQKYSNELPYIIHMLFIVVM